jgi:tetratricopeptide (TPR) repeat protein
MIFEVIIGLPPVTMKDIRGFMSVRVISLLLFVLPGLFAQRAAVPDALAKAQDLYHHADYQASLTLLHDSHQTGGRAFYLAGEDYFMLGDYKKATAALEQAFAIDPSSECAVWLGRSLGRRAETSMPLFAPKYATQARAYFEKAVQLDPNNPEALNDLFQYYLEAPGFLGGGYDKAEQIAKRIADHNPAQGHFAEAQLAERRKQFDTAEEQLRRAVVAAPHEVARVLDLARYLAARGRIAESEAAFHRAEQLEPNSPRIKFSRAQTYIEQKRNLEQAKALLHQYLTSDLTPDDPSREQAQNLLKEASGA